MNWATNKPVTGAWWFWTKIALVVALFVLRVVIPEGYEP
jgi:hypothetical protein